MVSLNSLGSRLSTLGMFFPICGLLLACKPTSTTSDRFESHSAEISIPTTNTTNSGLTSAEFRARHKPTYSPETPAEYHSNFLKRCEQVVNYPWKHPIIFAGRVVDNHGEPVSDAEVTFSWQTPPPERRTIKKQIISDATGYVELLHVKAPWIEIHVEKGRYFFGPRTRSLHLNYSDPYEPPPQQRYIPDRNKPYVLLLGRGTTNLVQHSWYAYFPIKANGKEFGWDIDKNVLSSSGQLGLKVEVTPLPGSTNSWKSVELLVTLPRAGFQASKEIFPFLAPTVGYEPELRIRMGDQETIDWPEHYYFHYDDGSGTTKYGVMQIRYGDRDQNLPLEHRRFAVNLSVWINEKGGREFSFAPDELPNSRNANTTLEDMLRWAVRP